MLSRAPTAERPRTVQPRAPTSARARHRSPDTTRTTGGGASSLLRQKTCPARCDLVPISSNDLFALQRRALRVILVQGLFASAIHAHGRANEIAVAAGLAGVGLRGLAGAGPRGVAGARLRGLAGSGL